MKYSKVKSDVLIADRLMRYMYDTLIWIPSTHSSGLKKREAMGLFLYGATIIDRNGAEIFYRVIKSWANLFSICPAEFELNGGVMINSTGKVSKPMKFYMIKVKTDELVSNLTNLAGYAEQVKKGDYYILHFGI